MRLDEELGALRMQLDALERGPAKLGDWHRFDAKVARLMIKAQHQLAAVQQEMIAYVRTDPPDPAWFGKQSQAHQIRATVDELRMFRLCAESRIFELEAEENQQRFSNWIDTTATVR